MVHTMGQALYRKYRSRSFEELQGQQHITSTLLQAIERGDINHAYLFTGPRGTGKTSVARILAHAINTLPYSDAPHLDIIEIDAASNRRVEDIRDLREKVHIMPAQAKYKVYIIDEVHMLTSESFNALLKTLEEPPAHVVFILATTELQKLPATITSRTQRFAFRSPTPAVIIQHLKTIADKEALVLDEDAFALIAEHGDGSFRDSVSLLDQVRSLAAPSETITETAVASLLGLPARTAVSELSSAAIAGDSAKVVTGLQQADSIGISPLTLNAQLIRLLMQQADNEHARRILEKLVLVPRSSHPAASLLLALLTESVPLANAAPLPPQKPASKPSTPSAQSTNSPAPAKVSVRASNQQATTKVEATPPPAPAIPSASFDFDTLSQQWGAILEAIKEHSPALYGTLRSTSIEADGEGMRITCKYAIHKKQLESAKHQTSLTAGIHRVTGMGQFPIVIVVDMEVVATKPLAAVLPKSEEANSVVSVMGGGEMVQYTG